MRFSLPNRFQRTPAPPEGEVPPADRRPAARAGGTGRRFEVRERRLRERFVYSFCRAAVRLFLRLGWSYRVFGADRVPAAGPALLVSNHASLLDPPVVGSALRREASYLARESLFRVPVLGWLIRTLGAMPIVRESAAPRDALERVLALLEAGRLLLFFPEGTRSRDGRLGTLKKGIAWAARRSGVPVVPVRIAGTFEAWPRHRRFPRRSPIRVFFGAPLRYDPKESADAFLERLRSAMEDLGRDELAREGNPLLRPEERPGSGSDASLSQKDSAAGRARARCGADGEPPRGRGSETRLSASVGWFSDCRRPRPWGPERFILVHGT